MSVGSTAGGSAGRSGTSCRRKNPGYPGGLKVTPSVITTSGSSMYRITGPITPNRGCASNARSKRATRFGATVVSLLSSRTWVAPRASAYRMPVLFPPLQPPLAGLRTT